MLVDSENLDDYLVQLHRKRAEVLETIHEARTELELIDAEINHVQSSKAENDPATS